MDDEMVNSTASRFVVSLAVTLLVFGTLLADSSFAQSGGKLRRAKTAVHDKPAPESKPNRKKLPSREERHKNESDQHDSRDDRDDKRNSRRNRNRGRQHDAGFRFFLNSAPSRAYLPTRVVACSLDAPAPLIVHQAPPQTVYETVVIEPVESPIVVSDSHEIGNDWFDFKTSKFWAVVGSDFDGITAGGLGLLLQAPGSFGLDSSVMMLRESGVDYRDHLWLGDVNLVYEVLSRGDIRGRVGLGVNWLSDSWGAESGLNLTAGVDMRLTHRLTLSAEGDFGNLGDADFLHGRVNLARRFESCELMLGVDHYNFGGAEVNSVYTGVQLRF
jgi:opacity protein-like surface antigen